MTLRVEAMSFDIHWSPLVILLTLLILLTVPNTDGTDPLVRCVFSEECVIPCHFHPASEEVIHWLRVPRSQEGPVHTYYEGSDQLEQQNQRYRGRTSLFKDNIAHGNASLQLRDVTIEDQGKYQCYTSTLKGNEESVINLEVEAPVHLVDIQLSGEIITCNSRGIYPAPELTWSTDPPSYSKNFQNSTSIKKDNQGLYDITSFQSVGGNVTDIVYICSVTVNTRIRRASLRQQAPVLGSTNGEVSVPCSGPEALTSFNITWIFNHTKPILTYTYTSTSQTAKPQVQDWWKDQVEGVSDAGSLQLHRLTLEHKGTYTCELRTAGDTYVTLTHLNTADKLSAAVGKTILIVLVVLGGLGFLVWVITRKCQGKKCVKKQQEVSTNQQNNAKFRPIQEEGENEIN